MTKFEIAAVKFRNSLNKTFPNSSKKIKASGVVCAGGSGNRMGGVAKQLLPLLSKPCILYSLEAMEKCPLISEIVVVCREQDRDKIAYICKTANITKLKCIVSGGDTRQKSVYNGFKEISKNSDIVVIHDAARPLIKSEHITKLIEKANRFGASCAAKKMVDTVKRADEKCMVLDTVERENLYTVQTPQVFKTDVYRVSVALADKDNIIGTDDCSLVEHAGFPIKLVDLECQNMKLTTPEDIQTIVGILKERENG